MPSEFSTQDGGCIQHKLIEQLTIDRRPEMPPLAHVQRNTRDHRVAYIEIDSTVLRIAESDAAVVVRADVIKAVMTATSKADALGYLAESAVARLSLAACAETTPNINWFDPTNGTRCAFQSQL
ncbi:hypothetical protein KR49_06405 [Synechococcus sp. KORDI-49]|nr:hypothetical protein KR49_06405 [Synechococcus sp. KORDI-49]